MAVIAIPGRFSRVQGFLTKESAFFAARGLIDTGAAEDKVKKALRLAGCVRYDRKAKAWVFQDNIPSGCPDRADMLGREVKLSVDRTDSRETNWRMSCDMTGVVIGVVSNDGGVDDGWIYVRWPDGVDCHRYGLQPEDDGQGFFHLGVVTA